VTARNRPSLRGVYCETTFTQQLETQEALKSTIVFFVINFTSKMKVKVISLVLCHKNFTRNGKNLQKVQSSLLEI